MLQWDEDADFELSNHVRRVPGNSWEDLEAVVAAELTTDFDLAHPLWRVSVLEGLPGGRTGVVGAVHHSMRDATSVPAMFAPLCMDLDPTGPGTANSDDCVPSAASAASRFLTALRHRTPGAAGVKALARAGDPSTLTRFVKDSTSVVKMVNHNRAPQAPINVEASERISVKMIAADLAAVKAAARMKLA